MMHNYNYWGVGGFGTWHPVFFPLLLLVVLWTLYWKYKALWKAAHLGHKGWFIAMLVINTVGILEILYIYKFSERNSIKTLEPKNPA